MRVEKIPLCKHCLSRFKDARNLAGADQDSDCAICRGHLSRVPKLAKEALAQSKGFEWGAFSVSSSFPRQFLATEAKIAEWLPPGAYSSLKNSANALLISEMAKLTGKENSQRGADASFEFDFIKNTARAKPNPVYIHGHYLKLSRGHCQSRWHCSDCGGRGCESCGGSGRNYPSVEDELGAVFCKAFEAEGCSLHASGREDVDVLCIGTGRPFVLELISPKKRSADIAALERDFSKNQHVRAIGLRMVKKAFIDAVCGSQFEKKYVATVSADRALTAKDALAAQSLSGQAIKQQTPKRVLSRRADMVRFRKIFSLKASAAPGGRLSLEILAESGTYIKELINSDGGRTCPSVSELLACSAKCDQLDVVEIRDYFLQTVLQDGETLRSAARCGLQPSAPAPLD